MKEETTLFNIEILRRDLIIRRCISLDISMEEASKQIGVSKSTLSRIENHKLPDIETFAKVCKWLGVNGSIYFNL